MNIERKIIIKSFWWKGLERFSSQLMNLTIQIILARLLIPDDFGVMAIIIAITNFASIFVQSGFAMSIIQKKNLDELDVSTIFIMSMALAFVIYILLFFLAPIIASVYESSLDFVLFLRISATSVFISPFISIKTGIFTRIMDFKTLFLRSIIAVPIAGTVAILLAFYDFGIWALIANNILNLSLTALLLLGKTEYKIKFNFSFARAKEIYKFSGKILFTSIVTVLSDSLRTLVIGLRYSEEELAYYNKGLIYSNYFVQIVNTTIGSVIFPSLSRVQEDLPTIKNMARRAVRLATFISFPILFGIIAVSPNLVIILLTDKWALAIPFLMIFCLLRIPGVFITIDKQVYNAIGKSQIGLIYEIVLAMMNIIALFSTIFLGTIYVALSITVMEYLGSIIIMVISRRVYNYSIRERLKDIWKPTVNGLIMGSVVLVLGFLPINQYILIFIQIIVAASLYLGLVFLTKDKNLGFLITILKSMECRTNRGDI